MKKRNWTVAVGIIFGLILLNPFFISSPKIQQVTLPSNSQDLNSWISQSELRFSGLKQEHKKVVLWKEQHGSEYVLVYIHGFSATRVEISPVVENLSADLNANVFFTRLSGHGLGPDEFGRVSSDDYFNDAEEAYQIAKLLGKKIILIGTSTGGTLATYLAAEHQDIYKLILISPNFGLNEPESFYLGGPFGDIVARIAVGSYRHWRPLNQKQAENWTTTYQTHALNAMMDVVNYVKWYEVKKINSPTLTLLSPLDNVISTRKAETVVQKIPGSTLKWVQSSDHILAGDIISPATTKLVTQIILDFIRCDKECSSK
jgi:esterase/lipase